MEAPVATTVLLVLVGALWHWRFSHATRVRRAEQLSRDWMCAGVVLFALGVTLFARRVGDPTSAETLATVAFDAGGAALFALGLLGWVTSNDAAVSLLNLTTETLVFVDGDGDVLFTLFPQFEAAVASLPPPFPGRYLIVPPALATSEHAAARTDLRLVDTSSARRANDGQWLLVQRLRAPT